MEWPRSKMIANSPIEIVSFQHSCCCSQKKRRRIQSSKVSRRKSSKKMSLYDGIEINKEKETSKGLTSNQICEYERPV